ncbi:MAG: DUF6119 family protein [Acidobacteriota bacterium]
MRAKSKQWPLSIFLLKEELTDVDAAVRSARDIHRIPIGRGRGTVGPLFYRSTPLRPPRWAAFFGSYLDAKDILCAGVAAALIVRADDRLFAVTFGTGRHLPTPGTFQEGFGLRVTLNSVSPESIRMIARKTLDATGCRSREQASRNIPIIEFGVGIGEEVLCGVIETPRGQHPRDSHRWRGRPLRQRRNGSRGSSITA